MILLQISSAQGPNECCFAVNKILSILMKEAKISDIQTDIQEIENGRYDETLRSVLLSIEGKDSENFVDLWTGTVQWIYTSPYRPNHKRKNWYIDIHSFSPVQEEEILDNEIKFEATRASGPGGQHINKTSSAIRATHISTGMSVKIQSERSQYANKRLAKALLIFKLQEKKNRINIDEKSVRRLIHHQIERGNPKRIFVGIDFQEKQF